MRQLFYPKEFARNPEFRTPAMAHRVPIATVRDNVYVLTDGSLAAVYEIEGMHFELAGDRETAEFSAQMQSILNTVYPGVQIKFLHRLTHNYKDLLDQHIKELDGDNSFARYVAWDQYRRYYQAMEEGELLRNRNLVVLTYNPKIPWWKAPDKVGALKEALFGLADGKANVVQRTLAKYRMAFDKFEDFIRPVYNQMVISGLKPERLNNEQLYDLAWEVLNPQLSLRQDCPKIRVPDPRDPYAGIFSKGNGQKIAKKNPMATVVAPITEREQLCASDWLEGDKWVRIDELYYTTVSMTMLPATVYPGMAVALANIPFEATISIDAYMLNKEKELEAQWSETRSEESKSQTTLFDGTPDPAKMQKAGEKRKRYMKYSAPNQNLFRLRMVVVVSAPDLSLLNQRAEAIISIMRNMDGVQGKRDHYSVQNVIPTTWPFASITDINSRKAATTEVAKMLPVFSRWGGSQRPVTLFMDPMRRLVKHDPFPANQLNRNKVICGKSGSGKSFTAQLADVQPMAAQANTEILIVESGGSFKLTTEIFGGMYLKLGPSSPYTINPFDLPPGFDKMTKEQKEAELRYKYGFIKNLVMAMARIKDPQSQMLAENVVGAVTQKTYQLSKKPRFRDFYKVLSQYKNPKDKPAEELAGRLMTLLANYVVDDHGTEGIYAKYFDTFTNFDVDLPIVAFDLADIKGDEALLTPMMMVTLLGLIYNRIMRGDGKDRLIIVDEAWALIKEGPNGELSPAGQGIELFWREGRKRNASSVMISQNFSDMHGDQIGRAVVGNSPIQYMLVHERLKANDEAFRGSGFSKEKIETIYKLITKKGEFAELLMREGDEWGVVRLPSVGLKYWLATTDPKDLHVRDRYFKTFKEGYGIEPHVVIAMLAEDYPGGVHTIAANHQEMAQDEALRFAEQWTEHYNRFAELVKKGEKISPDFE